MLVFLIMRPWSIFWPMPCTTNTMCVVSGGVSSGAASSTYPRWRRVPLLEAEDVRDRYRAVKKVFALFLFFLVHPAIHPFLLLIQGQVAGDAVECLLHMYFTCILVVKLPCNLKYPQRDRELVQCYVNRTKTALSLLYPNFD